MQDNLGSMPAALKFEKSSPAAILNQRLPCEKTATCLCEATVIAALGPAQPSSRKSTTQVTLLKGASQSESKKQGKAMAKPPPEFGLRRSAPGRHSGQNWTPTPQNLSLLEP